MVVANVVGWAASALSSVLGYGKSSTTPTFNAFDTVPNHTLLAERRKKYG
jgi:hypothetical protein